MAELGRLLTAMVTPYTPEGEVDYAHARRLAAHSSAPVTRRRRDRHHRRSAAPDDEEKHRLWAEVKQELGDRARSSQARARTNPPLDRTLTKRSAPEPMRSLRSSRTT